jgi:hypothetical protein
MLLDSSAAGAWVVSRRKASTGRLESRRSRIVDNSTRPDFEAIWQSSVAEGDRKIIVTPWMAFSVQTGCSWLV